MQTKIPDKKLLRKDNFKAFNYTVTRLVVLIFFLSIILTKYDIPIIFRGAALFFYFTTYSFLGMAGVSHELLHNSLFTNPKLNKLFYKLFSILTLNNYAYFQITHWKHHKKPLSDEDPKLLHSGKLPYITIFFWLTFDFYSFVNRFKILILNSRGIIPNYRIKEILKTEKNGPENICKASRLILVFHLIFVCFTIALNQPSLILFVTLAPFVFTFPNKILAISQHYGLLEDKDMFNSCRTVKLPALLSYTYANMNYHVEHHLFPGVPAYNLKQVHELLVREDITRFKNLSVGLFGLLKDLQKKGLFNS